MEIVEADAPYLDLRDDRERQAYAMIKHRSFGHTRAFDPDLLEKTGMNLDFARVWHEVGWDGIVPVQKNGSRLLTIQFLCTLQEVDNAVSFRLFGVERYFNWKISVTSLVLTHTCQFPLQKLPAVLIDMSFGV